MTHAFSPPRPALRLALLMPVGVAAVLLASLLYYGAAIDRGFNIADDGHYAQVTYELLLGTDPHELRLGYGLMWFKLGEWLFALAGPNWSVVQGIFHGVLAITAALLYATVARVTRSPALALLAAATAVVVPAFPATAFYPFCALLNVFFQTRMAERWRALTLRDVLAPAAALSLTFQIRPDFGFIFAVPLLGLLVLNALGGRVDGRGLRLARLCGAAAAAFAAVQAPIMLLAVMGGYLDLILVEVARYPLTLLRYFQAVSGATATPTQGTQGAAGALLARTPLAALWSGGPDAAMAGLIYGPIAVIGGFVVATAATLFGPGGFDRLPTRLIVLGGALSTLPHYLLFRPDLPHVANFMPGYLVLVCVLVADLSAIARRPANLPLIRAGAGAAILLPLAGVALYLWVGLTQPGGTAITASLDRTERFTAANGIAVWISPGERPLLEGVRDAVEASSRPGDRIVCVPFCPGLAFMTGRRMLLRDYYVDDSFLIRDPGWVGRTVETFRRERPPIVIVLDWAINGTEISRFQNWARPTITALDELGYQRRILPGAILHVAPAAP